DYPTAQTYALRLLELDPQSEPAYCYLIQIYAWMDERAAALRQYEACLLALDSLGMEPQAFTTALYEAVKNGSDIPTDNLQGISLELAPDESVVEPQQGNLPPNNIPNLLTAFVPRPNETALIAETLNRSDCRLLTLVGAGGVGKTRLALQTASEQMACFSDGT